MNPNLLQKYIAGDATPEEKKEIVRWLEADKKNRKEFLALRKIYDFSIWQDSSSSVDTPKGQKSSRYVLIREITKVAAIFLLAFVSVYLLLEEKNELPDVAMQTVFVPAGQRAELTLTDGTQVWLNAKTTFTFPNHFTDKNRTVKLDGEGYFKVTRNTKKPFTVQTAQYDITVLGTEFNVMAYSGTPSFETALIKGAVEVSSAGNGQKISLKPHTRAYRENGLLKKDSIENTDHFLWREGIISFDNEPVEKMIEKLQLYYDVTIQVKNKELFKNSYSGKFRIKDGVEHVLKVLQLNNKFLYDKNDDLNLITIQ